MGVKVGTGHESSVSPFPARRCPQVAGSSGFGVKWSDPVKRNSRDGQEELRSEVDESRSGNPTRRRC